jgi:cellulose synthase/poly-beta-1,6-N-acetylglucosamine synthase-like glycosyltransferase
MYIKSQKISIVIPAHNAGQTIQRCLDGLECQTVPRDFYEIIVVDDGSSDNTYAQVMTYKNVRLFKQQYSGPSAARNLGIQHARGEIVLFTDADCVPVQDWIECMVAPFQEEEVVGVKGTYLTRQREVVSRFVQLEFEEKYERMAREKYIDFIDTYSAGYRKSILVTNNGFDPSFPVASAEDQELSFRLARQGYKMVFVANAIVYHLEHPRDLRTYWRKKFNIGYWKVLVHKYHPDKLLRDSHTPQILKLQILLIGSICIFIPLGFLWLIPRWLIGIMGFLFMLSTIPFVVKAWSKDTAVALVSPSLLFIRAFALGSGFAVGLILNTDSEERIRNIKTIQSIIRKLFKRS